MDLFMNRLELEKENFKKSVCQQIDDLFVSLLNQFSSTLIESRKSVGRPRKLKKAISSGSSGKLSKGVSLLRTPISSPSSNDQVKEVSKISQNDSMASPVNLKKGKSNASQQEQVQQQYEGDDDGDDDEDNQTKNDMENDSNKGDETPMDEGGETLIVKVKLQQSPQQQQLQSQSNSKSKSSVKSSAKSSPQQTRFSPRIIALKQSRQFSSPSPQSGVLLINRNGFSPIYRRNLASRIVPPLQPEVLEITPKKTNVSVLKSSRWLNSSKKLKKHICRWCRKNFCTKQRLDAHELIHQGIRPYSCKWEGCQYTAIQEPHMTRHIRGRHFMLPQTVKEQIRLGIVDDRDPRMFVKVHKNLLEKLKMPEKTSENADDSPKTKHVRFSLCKDSTKTFMKLA